MRILFSLVASGLIAGPSALLAQTPTAASAALNGPTAQPSVLTPLPTVEATAPAPEPVAAKPAPPPVTDAAAPVVTSPPTTVAPDIVPKAEKEGLGDRLGTVVGGVAGGAAGAAVAGPVGKFAGGFIGKKLVQGVLGDKKDTPQVTAVAKAAPSAEGAGQPAVAAPATAPPPNQVVARNDEADDL